MSLNCVLREFGDFYFKTEMMKTRVCNMNDVIGVLVFTKKNALLFYVAHVWHNSIQSVSILI